MGKFEYYSHDVKVVVVGDGSVGKTCLLETFVTGKFPTEYIPTIFDHLRHTITVGNASTTLSLWDTAGQEGYARLRALSYVGANCIVFCYAINDADSLRNIQTVWLPEVKKTLRKPLFVLVGTKSDLRESDVGRFVSKEKAQKVRHKIGAAKLIECSAKHNENVQKVFQKVATVIQKHNDKSCILL